MAQTQIISFVSSESKTQMKTQSLERSSPVVVPKIQVEATESSDDRSVFSDQGAPKPKSNPACFKLGAMLCIYATNPATMVGGKPVAQCKMYWWFSGANALKSDLCWHSRCSCCTGRFFHFKCADELIFQLSAKATQDEIHSLQFFQQDPVCFGL